jgi:hypothetical protein
MHSFTFLVFALRYVSFHVAVNVERAGQVLYSRGKAM